MELRVEGKMNGRREENKATNAKGEKIRKREKEKEDNEKEERN